MREEIYQALSILCIYYYKVFSRLKDVLDIVAGTVRKFKSDAILSTPAAALHIWTGPETHISAKLPIPSAKQIKT